MTNGITTTNNDLLFEPNNLTKETIKKFLCPNASDQELMMGLQIAKTFNLNPLKREVYFVKYGNNPMQVLTGYEVYLKRAERSGQYNGLDITSQGSLSTGDLKAIVKVYRKDWTNPLSHEVYYSEYVQTKQDGTPNRFWKEKPITMIKKVAVSQAFRMAFPDEFDGMPYTADEVVDQEKIIDVKTEEKTPEPVPVAELPKDAKLTSQEGQDLLNALAEKFYTKEDLKQFIGDQWGLNNLSEIKTSHVKAIKEHFAKRKGAK